MPELDLRGCRTQPLLSYLKALGVLRLVGLTPDPDARLWWTPAGHARLVTRLDEKDVVAFFLDEYAPSPVTSPWNGGSGYYDGDNTAAIDAAAGTTSSRLEPLRSVIAEARTLVAHLPEPGAPKGDAKEDLLRAWRAQAPDTALEWMDAATVLTDSGVSMNPLLGTGGNDGRLEFSNNFLARLGDCLPHLFSPAAKSGVERSHALLERALFERGDTPYGTSKVGMFSPGTSGMPNSWSTSEPATGSSLLNPWDFVLMIEGSLLFSGGVGRRLSAQQALFPFTVTAGGVERAGRSMAGEGARGETWLPIWHQPARLGAVRRLLAEGRAQDGSSQARSGRSMGRATATLGVERGVDAFQRMVYAERFGRNYVAVPVDRLRVRASRAVELQRSADTWVRQARSAPGSAVSTAARRLDAAAHASIADELGAFERWLLALADLELAIARLAANGSDVPVRPLRGLPWGIARQLDDSPEVRLARALSRVGSGRESVPSIREVVEPVARDPRGRLLWRGKKGCGAAGFKTPLALLVDVAQTAPPVDATGHARLADVEDFLDARLDDSRVTRLAFALSICAPPDAPPVDGPRVRTNGLDRVYAIAYLAARAGETRPPGGEVVRLKETRLIIPALARGAVSRTLDLAFLRLRADGLNPHGAIRECARDAGTAHRIAASLAIPLNPHDRAVLEAAIFMPVHTAGGNET